MNDVTLRSSSRESSLNQRVHGIDTNCRCVSTRTFDGSPVMCDDHSVKLLPRIGKSIRRGGSELSIVQEQDTLDRSKILVLQHPTFAAECSGHAVFYDSLGDPKLLNVGTSCCHVTHEIRQIDDLCEPADLYRIALAATENGQCDMPLKRQCPNCIVRHRQKLILDERLTLRSTGRVSSHISQPCKFLTIHTTGPSKRVRDSVASFRRSNRPMVRRRRGQDSYGASCFLRVKGLIGIIDSSRRLNLLDLIKPSMFSASDGRRISQRPGRSR
ncbi:hypothetical protein X993_677 [Burkholderia pseudomallei K42]|nr:hypothetical protein X993_677 [Burkholderia pseudomallei K42]